MVHDGVRATVVRMQRIVSIVTFRSVHTVHISISISPMSSPSLKGKTRYCQRKVYESIARGRRAQNALISVFPASPYTTSGMSDNQSISCYGQDGASAGRSGGSPGHKPSRGARKGCFEAL